MGHIKLIHPNGTEQILGEDALRISLGDKIVNEAIQKSTIGELPIVNLSKHPIHPTAEAVKPKEVSEAEKPKVPDIPKAEPKGKSKHKISRKKK